MLENFLRDTLDKIDYALESRSDMLKVTDREVVLEGLLSHALGKLRYALFSSDEAIWISKVRDFQVSVNSYLSTNELDDLVYPHNVKNNKGE
jgi:hypothetical protein